MKLYNSQDLAKALGISYATVHAKIKEKLFSPVMYGGSYVFSEDEFRRSIKAYRDSKQKKSKKNKKKLGKIKSYNNSMEILAYLKKMDEQHQQMLQKIIDLTEAVLILSRDNENREPKPPKLANIVLKK